MKPTRRFFTLLLLLLSLSAVAATAIIFHESANHPDIAPPTAPSQELANSVQIRVHVNQSQGPMNPVWNYFGYDEPNYTYAPNGKKLLSELTALDAKPVYVRVHNLFTSGDGSASLKWGSSQRIYRRFEWKSRVQLGNSGSHFRRVSLCGSQTSSRPCGSHPQCASSHLGGSRPEAYAICFSLEVGTRRIRR